MRRNNYEATRSPESKALQRVNTEKWRKANPDRAREIRRHAAAKWRKKHPETDRERNRNKWLKFKYQLSPEQWEQMFNAQNRKCQTCGTTDPGQERGGRKCWHTDHCHKTGRVRGILCRHCNHAIGNARDNPAVLRALAEYVENANAISANISCLPDDLPRRSFSAGLRPVGESRPGSDGLVSKPEAA